MMFNAIPGFQLAGALVRRPYSTASGGVRTGTVLSPEAFDAIGYDIRRIFVASGQVMPFYQPDGTPPLALAPIPPPVRAERHVIHRGGGRYDVVEGRLLNDEALSREDADDLAAHGA